MKKLGPALSTTIVKESIAQEEADAKARREEEAEDKRKKAAGEKAEGLKPKEGMFDDGMWRKLEMDPVTRQYLYDPWFVQKMRTLQENPNLLKMYMMIKEPKVIDGLGVIMGFGRDGLKNCHVGGSMAPPPDMDKLRKERRRRKR